MGGSGSYEADADQACDDGWTPLVAAQKGHLDIANALVAAGADINQARKDGVTPLYIASFEGHLDIVKALIEAGANRNKARIMDVPVIAAQNGHFE